MSLEKTSFENHLLDNQQKEMRAYDQKAGYYITSNSGLFVIALFTLCIFTMFHQGHNDICKFSWQWWSLFVLTIIYVILFIASNACCFCVLFARVKRKNDNEDSLTCHSLTNPLAIDVSNFENDFEATKQRLTEIQKKHIKSNIIILKRKHFFANLVPPLSILMGVLLLILTILLFVF